MNLANRPRWVALWCGVALLVGGSCATRSTSSTKGGRIPCIRPTDDHPGGLRTSSIVLLRKDLGTIPPDYFIEQAMSCSVDPCDDFYSYACGGLRELDQNSRLIPVSMAEANRLNQATLSEIFRVISETTETHEQRAAIHEFLTTCQDLEARSASGWNSVRPWIDGIRSAETLDELILQDARVNFAGGGDGLLDLGVSPDPLDGTLLPHLDAGALGLPRTKYTKAALVSYERYLASLGATVGIEPDAIAEVIAFEHKLVELYETYQGWKHGKRRLSLEEAQARAPHIDIIGALAEGRMDREGQVLVLADRLSAFDELLAKTDLRVLRDYAALQHLNGLSAYGPPDAAVARLRLDRELGAVHEESSLKGHCFDQTASTFGAELSEYFTQIEVSKREREATEEIVQGLRSAMQESPLVTTMFSEDVQEDMHDKIRDISIVLDGAEAIQEDAYRVGSGGFLETRLHYRRVAYRRRMERLGTKEQASDPRWSAYIANASYVPRANALSLSPGLFQEPLLNFRANPIVNYARLGTVVGHEYGHAIDPNQVLRDEHGNLRSYDASHLGDRYSEYVECLEGQADSAGLDGDRVVAENFADAVGLWLGRAAYVRSASYDDRRVFRGVTNEQAFFVMWAQMFCRHEDARRERWQQDVDVHSPSAHRVNLAAYNNTAFLEAFSCVDTAGGLGSFCPLPQQDI